MLTFVVIRTYRLNVVKNTLFIEQFKGKFEALWSGDTKGRRENIEMLMVKAIEICKGKPVSKKNFFNEKQKESKTQNPLRSILNILINNETHDINKSHKNGKKTKCFEIVFFAELVLKLANDDYQRSKNNKNTLEKRLKAAIKHKNKSDKKNSTSLISKPESSPHRFPKEIINILLLRIIELEKEFSYFDNAFESHTESFYADNGKTKDHYVDNDEFNLEEFKHWYSISIRPMISHIEDLSRLFKDRYPIQKESGNISFKELKDAFRNISNQGERIVSTIVDGFLPQNNRTAEIDKKILMYNFKQLDNIPTWFISLCKLKNQIDLFNKYFIEFHNLTKNKVSLLDKKYIPNENIKNQIINIIKKNNPENKEDKENNNASSLLNI